MKLFFIADPPEKLKPAGDSTLALLRTCLNRKHECFWAIDTDVEYGGELGAWASRVVSCPANGYPALEAKQWHLLPAMDRIFIRKDPPFDAGYVRLCWILALAENRIWMMNRPSCLLRYHEKLIPLDARSQGFLQKDDIIPTHLGSLESAKAFVRNGDLKRVIVKPFLGFGGNGVQLMSQQEFLDLTQASNDIVVQPFHREVEQFGDRRVFFLQGELLAHFVRMPKAGGFISNLAQGGTAVRAELTPGQAAVCARLGRFLKAARIAFAGADVIGERISEANITSPTGLRNLAQLEGRDYTDEIIDFAEKGVLV